MVIFFLSYGVGERGLFFAIVVDDVGKRLGLLFLSVISWLFIFSCSDTFVDILHAKLFGS